MEDQVARRAGTHPEAYLVDGGYAQRDTITTLTERQITVYAPVRPPRTVTSGRECSSPRSDDSPAVVAWCQRMETEDAHTLYKLRAATAEWAKGKPVALGNGTHWNALLPVNTDTVDSLATSLDSCVRVKVYRVE